MRDPDEPDLFAAAPLPIAPLDDAQRLACLRLIRSENVGPVTFRALINHYGGASEALATGKPRDRRGDLRSRSRAARSRRDGLGGNDRVGYDPAERTAPEEARYKPRVGAFRVSSMRRAARGDRSHSRLVSVSRAERIAVRAPVAAYAANRAPAALLPALPHSPGGAWILA